jgi:hypothetical protein
MKPLRIAAIGALCATAILLRTPVDGQARQRIAKVANDVERCSTNLGNTTEAEENGRTQPTTSAEDGYCIEVRGDPSVLRECVLLALKQTGWLPSSLMEAGTHLSVSRVVDPDELARIAFTGIAGGRVQWSEGRVDTAWDLEPHRKNTTTVRIMVRILGRGTTSLPIMRPSDWWPLASTGTLERKLLNSIAAKCAANSKTGPQQQSPPRS